MTGLWTLACAQDEPCAAVPLHGGRFTHVAITDGALAAREASNT